MLNNKKNLLQRVRIVMVAIVTIMGIGSAFAMKTPSHKAVTTWNVVQTIGNYYKVTQSMGRCDDEEGKECAVQSSALPDSQKLIPISSATVTEEGQFYRSR